MQAQEIHQDSLFRKVSCDDIRWKYIGNGNRFFPQNKLNRDTKGSLNEFGSYNNKQRLNPPCT